MKTILTFVTLIAFAVCVNQTTAQVAQEASTMTSTYNESSINTNVYANAGTHATANGHGCHRPWGYHQAEALWIGYCNEAFHRDECGFLGLKCLCHGFGHGRGCGRCHGCLGGGGCLRGGGCGCAGAGGDGCCSSAWPGCCDSGGTDCGCGGGLLQRGCGCGGGLLNRMGGGGACCDSSWPSCDCASDCCGHRHGVNLFSRLGSRGCGCGLGLGSRSCDDCCDSSCDGQAPATEGAVQTAPEASPGATAENGDSGTN